MSRAALSALLLALALAVLAGPPVAAAAGPAKDDDLDGAGTGGPAAAETGAAGRALPGARGLLVTFADVPPAVGARARLAGLGAVRPALPEAGVWSLIPDEPDRARDRALARPGVSAAEWLTVGKAAELPRPPAPPAPGPAPAFTDPLFTPAAQWSLLGGTPAWSADLTTPAGRPRIAILDSGVDPTHEEWAGPSSPLVAPYSTLRGDDDASDVADSGHGTHVAGIAAAPANGVGIVGVAPADGATAQIIPVQIANRLGESSELTMIRGIRYAVRNGARVLNISAGGDKPSRAFQEAILWATRQGAVVVASAGNDYSDTLNYPAAYRHVIGVGAECDGQPSLECPRPFGVAAFSNRNRSVDVIAPGVNVLSSVPRRVTDGAVRPGYALKDGTSMSAAYVSGVAALVMASNGNALSPYQVTRQIENTADDLGLTGRDDASGYGVVNPRAAVTLQAPADDDSEINDDVKWLSGAKLLSQIREPVVIEATLDRYEDPDDVYAVTMRRGERIRVQLTYRRGVADLYLWKPGTTTVRTQSPSFRRHLIKFRGGDRKTKTIVYVAKKNGRHFVNVYARRGRIAYTVTLERLGPQ